MLWINILISLGNLLKTFILILKDPFIKTDKEEVGWYKSCVCLVVISW
jgi:hypothetical protein